RDGEVEAAHQDQQRLPGCGQAGEGGEREDLPHALPARQAQARRRIGVDGDQENGLQDRETCLQRDKPSPGAARTQRSNALRSDRAHVAFLVRAASPPSMTATSSMPPYMTCR